MKKNALVVISNAEAAAAEAVLAEWLKDRSPPRDKEVAVLSAILKLRKAFGNGGPQ